MTQRVAVKVFWTSPLTGRSKPFAGRRYSTMSAFPENQARFTDETWSVTVHFAVPPAEQGNPSLGEAEFLMPDAPHEWMGPGAVFELYEGPRLTAVVQVAPDARRTDPPAQG